MHKLKISTITKEFFVAVDKEGFNQSYLFYYRDIDKIIFKNKNEAIKRINELRQAYQCKR